jgi:hypothetical protein
VSKLRLLLIRTVSSRIALSLRMPRPTRWFGLALLHYAQTYPPDAGASIELFFVIFFFDVPDVLFIVVEPDDPDTALVGPPPLGVPMPVPP